HHDHVVLGAAKTLHAFAVRRAGGENVLRDRGRTDEADRSYARIGEQHVDRFLVAVDDVEHALRQPSFEKQFGDAQRHRRIALRRFENESIAASNGRSAFPQWNHCREIKWRDAGNDSEWLAHGEEVNPRSGALAEFTLHQVWNAAGELDDFEAALDIALGIL